MNNDTNIHANHGRHRPSGGRRADNRDADIASPRPEIVEVARQRNSAARSTALDVASTVIDNTADQKNRVLRVRTTVPEVR